MRKWNGIHEDCGKVAKRDIAKSCVLCCIHANMLMEHSPCTKVELQSDIHHSFFEAAMMKSQ